MSPALRHWRRSPRPSTLVILALLALGAAGCGSGSSDQTAQQQKVQQIKDQVHRIQQYVAQHQSSSDEHQIGDASTVMARQDRPPSRKCPQALRAGRNAASHALSALRDAVPRLYRPPSFRIKGYSIVALFSLDPTAQADASIADLHKASFSPGLYRRKAMEACGATVASRSWLAVMDFPRAAMATLDPALAYLARTHRGWKVWYQWEPNLSKPAFPGE
jgi:hypothetical protein